MNIEIPEIGSTVRNADGVAKIFRAILEMECDIDRDKEHFWVIGLSQANKIKYIELVSLGILNASLVHPREVFRFAIMKAVAGIILVHNHPSGETNPSEQDIRITKQLSEAGKILGIKLYDHVILGEGPERSFANEGLI